MNTESSTSNQPFKLKPGDSFSKAELKARLMLMGVDINGNDLRSEFIKVYDQHVTQHNYQVLISDKLKGDVVSNHSNYFLVNKFSRFPLSTSNQIKSELANPILIEKGRKIEIKVHKTSLKNELNESIVNNKQEDQANDMDIEIENKRGTDNLSTLANLDFEVKNNPLCKKAEIAKKSRDLKENCHNNASYIDFSSKINIQEHKKLPQARKESSLYDEKSTEKRSDFTVNSQSKIKIDDEIITEKSSSSTYLVYYIIFILLVVTIQIGDKYIRGVELKPFVASVGKSFIQGLLKIDAVFEKSGSDFVNLIEFIANSQITSTPQSNWLVISSSYILNIAIFLVSLIAVGLVLYLSCKFTKNYFKRISVKIYDEIIKKMQDNHSLINQISDDQIIRTYAEMNGYNEQNFRESILPEITSLLSEDPRFSVQSEEYDGSKLNFWKWQG